MWRRSVPRHPVLASFDGKLTFFISNRLLCAYVVLNEHGGLTLCIPKTSSSSITIEHILSSPRRCAPELETDGPHFCITAVMLHISNAREQRIRPLKEIIVEYLVGYRLRNRGPRFANYALGHVKRIVANKLTVDIDAAAVLNYWEDRLREGASAESVNEEVRFRLNMLGDPGEIVPA